MAKGLLAEMFEKDNKSNIEYMKRNNMKKLLASLYITAESWARQKGIRLEDVEIVNEEMSMDGTNATWRFIKSAGAQEQKKSGLLGADGLPIELSAQ